MKELFEKAKADLKNNDGFLDDESIAYGDSYTIVYDEYIKLWQHIAELAGHKIIDESELLIYVEVDGFQVILRWLCMGQVANQMIIPGNGPHGGKPWKEKKKVSVTL